MKFRLWLQLFRAQTMPATLLLVLVPYLMNAQFLDLKTLVLALTLILIHYFSFGENSLMDAAMGYDQRDPSKRYHPLISSGIKIHEAHNVIHWGLSALTAWTVFLTLWISPNAAIAMTALILWVAFGHAYNDGLSKESPFGFLAISICCTASGAWGFFLSHVAIDTLGILYLGYVFFTILFQISYSGFIKELEIRERSNILTRMGAFLDVTWKGEKVFKPGGAWIYGWFVKVSNLLLGLSLLLHHYSLVGSVTFIILMSVALFYLYRLTKPRKYERNKDLLAMSLEEVATIYIPLFVLLPPLESATLGIIGILYFFLINKVLWLVPYPAV